MKYKRIRIHADILLRWMTQGMEVHIRCIRGVPEGARFVNSITDLTYGVIDLIIEHESFPELKDGDLIPEFEEILFTEIEEKK